MNDLVIPFTDTFTGEYEFRSNFAKAPTTYGGAMYPTS